MEKRQAAEVVVKHALVALLGFLAPMSQAEEPSLEVIDLTASRLERLAAEDPGRFVKVEAILQAAGSATCENDTTRFLKASQDLKQMHCAFLLLTSFPAKRHVYFVLDDVAYSARVVMTGKAGSVMKALETR